MQSKAQTPEAYLAALHDDRKAVVEKLRTVILKNLPSGFEEIMNYGMLGYVVPHSIYPDGYHCDPKLPLPFLGLASQKNYIAFHHMGLYMNQPLNDWFVGEYPRHSKAKLDMGKGCVRFKKMDDVPYDLIGELVTRISVSEWITMYENILKRR